MMESGAIPELPKGWVRTRLKDVIEDIDKVNPRDDPNKSFIYIDISSIDNTRQKIVTPKEYYGKNAPSRAKQLIKEGDILFSTVRTYLRNVAIVDDIYNGQIASTGFCVIRPTKEMNGQYLYYHMLTNDFINPLSEIQRGTSYPAVRNSDVYNQEIQIPPHSEQQRIVSKIEELFTKLDAGVAGLQTVKAQLRSYRQSVLTNAFNGKLTEEWRKAQKGEIEPASKLLERIKETKKKKLRGNYKEFPSIEKNLPKLPEGWTWARFDFVCEKIQDGSHFSPKIQYDSPGKERYLYITAKNIKENGLDLSDVTFIDYSFHKSIYERCNPEKGDVLIIKDGVKTGIATINTLEEEFSLLSSVALLKTNKSILTSSYLKHFLNSPIGFRLITGKMTGTAIKRIILEKIRTSSLPIPPPSEQLIIITEIERRLSITEVINKSIEQSNKLIARLRQSILKTAFRGQLVPQDPTDEPAEKLLKRIKTKKEKQEQDYKIKRKTKKKSKS